MANLERCKAQQTIHLRNYDPEDHLGVYGLYLRAYGDEQLARMAQASAAELLVERRCKR